MNVWKPIDQVVLPPKKVYKYIFDQNKGYWSYIEQIYFWNVFFSGCSKTYMISTCNNCLIDDWKPIDLVIVLPRSVYNYFFRSKRGLLKPHETNSLLKRFSGFYRVIFYICIFTRLHNPKLAKFSWFFCFKKKKLWNLGWNKLNLKITGSFHGKSARNSCLKFFFWP